ncbi:MAG: class I SAM-dependent methyltransferase [Candidatus Paceibacterota bacterium]|jgi:SAM-dependent methyltransferase
MMDSTIRYRANIIAKAYAPFLSEQHRVLDVGCGNGIVGEIIQKHTGCTMAGTDRFAYTKTALPFTQMTSDTELPFEDASFDYAMFNDVLHHLPYEEQLPIVKEALRVSKNVLIFELHPTLLARAIDWGANKIHYLLMPIPFSFRTLEGWRTFFTENGIPSRTFQVQRPAYYPISNFVLLLGQGVGEGAA